MNDTFPHIAEDLRRNPVYCTEHGLAARSTSYVYIVRHYDANRRPFVASLFARSLAYLRKNLPTNAVQPGDGSCFQQRTLLPVSFSSQVDFINVLCKVEVHQKCDRDLQGILAECNVKLSGTQDVDQFFKEEAFCYESIFTEKIRNNLNQTEGADASGQSKILAVAKENREMLKNVLLRQGLVEKRRLFTSKAESKISIPRFNNLRTANAYYMDKVLRDAAEVSFRKSNCARAVVKKGETTPAQGLQVMPVLRFVFHDKLLSCLDWDDGDGKDLLCGELKDFIVSQCRYLCPSEMVLNDKGLERKIKKAIFSNKKRANTFTSTD